DQFDVNHNYGVLSNNRTHLFNAAYSIQLPDATKNKLLGGFANGWQVSGILQVESGPNLNVYQGGNFFMGLSGVFGPSGSSTIIPGSVSAQHPTGIPISNVSLLGTQDIQLLP